MEKPKTRTGAIYQLGRVASRADRGGPDEFGLPDPPVRKGPEMTASIHTGRCHDPRENMLTCPRHASTERIALVQR